MKHKKCREIPREFDLTAFQGHTLSSILVSMESPYDFLLVIIVTLAVLLPFSRYSRLKIGNC